MHPFSSFLLILCAITATGDDPASDSPIYTQDERSHWAFQKVVRPPVPEVKNKAWVRNEIDHFVLAGLETKGWHPTASPSPLALLRRVHFDLTGLPPTPTEQDAFLRDPSPEALDRVVDELLARPTYGERWARHWLDLVRYAESNGYERDATKPSAWRYRDWVIRSFNSDKPYNRFLIEQIAGDEILDANADSLIATGFARLGPWDDEPSDPKQDRFDQLDDIVAATSEVALGLTIACARCHDHKFEPISQVDYYRMVAIFNPLERPAAGRTELDQPAGTPAQIEALTARDREITKRTIDRDAILKSARIDFLKSPSSTIPAHVRDAFLVDSSTRNDDQSKLVHEFLPQIDQAIRGSLSPEMIAQVDRIDSEIKTLREKTPDLPMAYFLRESPTIPTTHLLNRGQAIAPGRVVEPGFPTILTNDQPRFPNPDGGTSQRRLILARWLTQPDHPLVARVIVNRVWQFHTGQGIVGSPSDFGTSGDPPTHPELLDWLAHWFVHDANWSIKKLHKLILTSQTSRMGKARREDYASEDPDNALLWRMPYRRMEVEALRDAMLAASGQLNPAMYGPSMFPEVPKGSLEGNSDPDKVWKASDEREASRRTIYAFVKRSLIVPMLEVLDFCDTTRSSARRVNTSTAPQALALMNGSFVNRQAEHFADRLIAEAGSEPARQIELAYRLALARPARPDEIDALTAYLEHEAKAIGGPNAARAALVRMARVIFNLNEFAYTD